MSINSPRIRSISQHAILIHVNYHTNQYGGTMATADFLAGITMPGPLYFFLQEYTRVHGDDLSGLNNSDGAGANIRVYNITGMQIPGFGSDHYAVKTNITFMNYGLRIHDLGMATTGSLWSALFEMRLLAQGMR
jgi:hypothetical protein